MIQSTYKLSRVILVRVAALIGSRFFKKSVMPYGALCSSRDEVLLLSLLLSLLQLRRRRRRHCRRR